MCMFSVFKLSCYHAPSGQGCQSGQSSLHLSHQVNRGFSVSMSSRDRTTHRWCHLSIIAGTTGGHIGQIFVIFSEEVEALNDISH